MGKPDVWGNLTLWPLGNSVTSCCKIGFSVDPIDLVGRLQMRTAAFVQFGCIRLDTTPNAGGIHPDIMFGHQLREVFVRNGYLSNPRTHEMITSPGSWRPLNGLFEVVGIDFYLTASPPQSLKTEHKVTAVAVVSRRGTVHESQKIPRKYASPPND